MSAIPAPSLPERPSSAPLPIAHEPLPSPQSIQKALEFIALSQRPILFAPIAPGKYTEASVDLQNPGEYHKFINSAIQHLDLPSFRQIPIGCLADEAQTRFASLSDILEIRQRSHAKIAYRRERLQLMRRAIEYGPSKIPTAPKKEESKEPCTISECIAQLLEEEERQPRKDLSENVLTPLLEKQFASQNWGPDLILSLQQKPKAEFQTALAQAALDQYDISIFELLPAKTIAPLLGEIKRRLEIYLKMEEHLLKSQPGAAK